MIKRRSHRRGVALIPALLILSIVASSAALLDLGQQIWIRQTENLRDRAQADELARAALSGAVAVLGAYRYESATPQALEMWSKQAPLVTIEDQAPGSTSSEVNIRSAEGLFNLNSLLVGGNASVEDVAVFRRLLATAGLNPDLSDAVLDWMDGDDERRPNGAEDREYLGQTNGHRAANRPFESVDELNDVRGFTPAGLEKLRPLICALPERTAVDVNAAPMTVLTALFSDGTVELGQRLERARKEGPFRDAFDLRVRAGADPAGAGTYGFRSRYFFVRADGRVNRARRKTESLVFCPPAFGAGHVIWRSDVF